MLIKWLKIRAKGVLCFSQGFGNRFPAANRWDKRAKLILADDLSAALDARLPAGTMIPHSELHEFLAAQDVSLLNLQSVFIASEPPTNSEQTKSSPRKGRLLTKNST